MQCQAVKSHLLELVGKRGSTSHEHGSKSLSATFALPLRMKPSPVTGLIPRDCCKLAGCTATMKLLTALLVATQHLRLAS